MVAQRPAPRYPPGHALRGEVPWLQGLPRGRDARPSGVAGGGTRGGAGGAGGAARDQYVLHHRRGGGEVPPVGAPLVEERCARGVRGRLRGEPPRGASSPRSTRRCARSPAPRRTWRRRWRMRKEAAWTSSTSQWWAAGAGQHLETRSASAGAREASSRCRTAATVIAPTASSRLCAARARSRPAAAVLEEVRGGRVRRGQPEVVMTGISVGDYRDPRDGWELGELMMQAAKVRGRGAGEALLGGGDPRARLAGSRRCGRSRRCARTCTCRCSPATTACCERWDATTPPRSISRRSCRYAMRCPGVNVTTDIIVGFPNEDEAAFERTLGLVG